MKKMVRLSSKKNQKGQVWVETVVYTLIAFALMGLVLAFAKPKIEEIRDNAIIEQSLSMMEQLDLSIREIVQASPGNKRIVEVAIRKGDLEIDGANNRLVFKFEGKKTYTEPGINKTQGNLVIRTEKLGKINFVDITSSYSNYNITYDSGDNLKTLSKASTPYNLLISNDGKDSNEKTIVNVEVQ